MAGISNTPSGQINPYAGVGTGGANSYNPSSAPVAANGAPDLFGAGSYLDTTFDDSTGTAGGADTFLAKLKTYDPTAHYEDVYDSEGSKQGKKIVYDYNNPIFKTMPKGIEMNNVRPDAQGNMQGIGTDKLIDPRLQTNTSIWGKYASPLAFKNDDSFFQDPGNWGPLVVGGVAGLAGMGALTGFNGMSNAAAQGLVSGTTGSGLSSAGALPFGMSPNQALGLTKQAGGMLQSDGKFNPMGLVNAGLGVAGNALGMTPAQQMLARFGVGLASQGGK